MPRTATQLTLKIRACPRHPKYNPDVDGEEGIKAGCRVCGSIFTLFQDAKDLNELTRKKK